jgi:hypothetical protein
MHTRTEQQEFSFKSRSAGLWRRVVLCCVVLCCGRRWRQHGLLKRWYPSITLHGVTTLKIEAVWTSETVSYHNPEDGGSMDFWNSILPQHYTALQPCRSRLESPPPWKPHISRQEFSLTVNQINSSSSFSTPFALRALGICLDRGSHYFLESLYTPGRWLA